jgi:hypothetical protein
MADKKDLILVASKSMDNNQKPDRDENSLVRMPASTRNSLGFGDDPLEIVSKAANASATAVNVFQAFSKDIKALKSSGKYSDEELKRVAFVTSRTFRQITGRTDISSSKDIWASKTPFETLIGADPEFLLFDHRGKVIRANNVMQKEGKIGSDGAMGEVRPDPARDPKELIKNIQQIFADDVLTQRIQDYIWKACVYHKDEVRDYPVGGHIHLGNPPGVTSLAVEKRMVLFAVVNKIIDELLAIPLVKHDGEKLGKSRRSECQMALGNNGYGFYGEWRQCNGRLEHRTLSGLWLMHPEFAESVIGTAKAIADEAFGLVGSKAYNLSFFKHPDIGIKNYNHLYRVDFDGWEAIGLAKAMDCIKPSSYMTSMLNSSKTRSVTRPFLTTWYKKMKRMSTYQKYSTYIDKLYEILKMTKTKVDSVGFDIKANWLTGKKFL